MEPSRTSSLVFSLVMGPLLIMPIAAAEAHRLLAYLPILSAILGTISLRICYKHWPSFRYKIVLSFAFFAMIMAVSLTFSVYFNEAFERFLKIVTLGFLYGVCLFAVHRTVTLTDSDFYHRFIKYLSISCVFGAVLICLDILMGMNIFKFVHNKADTSNYTTAVLNPGAVVVTITGMFAFFSLDNKEILLKILLAITIVAMILLAQSQSAQLSLFVGVLFYFIFPFRFKFAWVGVFVLMMTGMLVMPFAVQVGFDYVAESLNDIPFFKNGYASNRLEIWDFIARKALEKPWVGHGLEFTKMYHDFDTQQIYHPQVDVRHPHNFVLQMWIETGLAGVLMWICFFGATIRRIYVCKDENLRRIALTVFIACFSVGVVSHGMWQGWWLGFLVMLLAVFVVLSKSKKFHTVSIN